jgi:hypothetical protein
MATQATPQGGGSLDLGQGFKFFFEDPDWVKKILLGGLFTLLSSVFVGLFFIGGYFLRLVQRAARGEARPLPEWDDLGGIFQDGLKLVGVYLVYSLGAALIPLSIGCVIGLAGGGMSALTGSSRDSGLAEGALVVGVIVFYVLIALISLVLLIYLPAAFVRLALSGRFGAAFEFRENFGFIGRNLGNYALAILLYVVVTFVSQFGILLLCVGIFPGVFWSYCVLGWALGEVARRDSASR